MRHIIFVLLFPLMMLFSVSLKGQNVIENEEAYLKEFDLYSFKDAETKIKDSSVLFIHMVGVKYGYAISNVRFVHTKIHKSIKSPVNAGIYYTYLHSLLGNMPYFGIQTGLALTQVGYTHVTGTADNIISEEPQVYDAVELPLLSIFRADIDRIRLMLGIGGVLSYIYDTQLPDGIPSTTKKGNFGIMGQAGIAFKIKPFELHIEAGYKYGLTPFLDHKFYSEQQWIYTNPTQLFASAGLNVVLGGKYYRNKKK